MLYVCVCVCVCVYCRQFLFSFICIVFHNVSFCKFCTLSLLVRGCTWELMHLFGFQRRHWRAIANKFFFQWPLQCKQGIWRWKFVHRAYFVLDPAPLRCISVPIWTDLAPQETSMKFYMFKKEIIFKIFNINIFNITLVVLPLFKKVSILFFLAFSSTCCRLSHGPCRAYIVQPPPVMT